MGRGFMLRREAGAVGEAVAAESTMIQSGVVIPIGNDRQTSDEL